MSTTLDAMLAGSHATVYVVAIEGYPYLLTNGDPAAAVTAWAAHGDYVLALGGLTVQLDNDQSMNPWEPFQGGGKCLLRVIDETGDDTFGIDTHRKGAGFSTQLTATIDRDDTTINVKNVLGWPTSGTAYIGSEAITYTGVTSTTLTGVTRGKWSPMWAGDTPPVTTWARFARTHRVGTDPNSVQLQPVVSTQPRVWDGKLVTVWAHRLRGGVLDVVAEAQCVYAGTIAEITDDGKGTTVHLRHVLDQIKDASLGHDTWTAKVPAGVYLHVGMTFQFRDRAANGEPWSTAANLVVVDGAEASLYEISAAIYTLEQIMDRINRWLSASLAASTIEGTHSMAVAPINTSDLRSKVYSYIPGTALFTARYEMRVPLNVAMLMGFTDATLADYQSITDSWLIYKEFSGATNFQTVSPRNPLRAVILDNLEDNGTNPFDINKITVYDEQGEFADQLAYLPEPSRPNNDLGLEWGIFLFDGRFLVFAAKDGDELGSVIPTKYQYAGTEDASGLNSYHAVPFSADAPDYFEIRQVLILEMPVVDFLRRVLYSTGTPGHNGADDVLPYAISVGLPGGLLKNLAGSGSNIPGSSDPISVVIDKPTKLSAVLGADLVIRRSFPVWRNGGVQMGTWKRPDASSSVAVLDEDNKAAPMGTEDDHRNASTQTDAWKRPIIKINYNRDLTNLEDGGYKDAITIKDRVSIDDSGGDVRMVTLDARNTFGQLARTGTSIEALIPSFLPALELFTRAAWQVTRTINPTLFESLTVGDVVLVTDSHARDPITGARGIAARPALVVRHRASPGGLVEGGDATPPGGEVTLLFSSSSSTLVDAVYAPSADVDSTYATGGYTAGYNSSLPAIMCHAARYSQSIEYFVNGYPILDEEAADATHFDVGDEVLVIERDPYATGSPLSWRRTVTAQSGNSITLSSALTGFDTSKKYAVTFANYNNASAEQQAGHVFQADDADGLILDTWPSLFVYTSGTTDLAYAANTSTEVELPVDSRSVDGASRDVWTDASMARLIDNLHDYKTAHHGARYLAAEITGTGDTATDLRMVAQWPIFLTLEDLTGAMVRLLSVAPMFYSSTGDSVTCRVSLSRTPVVSSYTLNVTVPSPFSFVDFTTDGTSYVAQTPKNLVANVKGTGTGVAWLQLHISTDGVILGLSRLSEGLRYSP